ncbi:MAG: ferric reductase-like transmembrane domain-containing protein [Frankiaceae bacterium]
MTGALASTSGSALWYFSRATGVVTLGLLTLVVLLGVLTRGGKPLPGLPRFAVAGLHRNASLLVLVMLAVHISAAVLDSYAPISLADAVIPFVSAYRPFWLGLGALSFDLLLAVIATSLLRPYLGVRVWKAVHWAAYAAWPVALVHGLGTGTDASEGWMLAFTAVCVGVAVLAVIWRVVDLSSAPVRRKAVAVGAVVAAPLGLVVWMLAGPLAPQWASRAGTPTSLLASPAAATSSQTTPAPRGRGSVNGALTESGGEEDSMTVALAGTLSGNLSGRLTVELHGTALAGEKGLSLSSGTVTVTASDGARYSGAVSGLNGNEIRASLSGPGGSVSFDGLVDLNRTTGQFTGTVTLA